MIKRAAAIGLVLVAATGCVPANVSPGMTFAVGLNDYHEEMSRLAARPDRWPDRQRMAESLKSVYIVTIGGSREFNQLVDLDLRRKEYEIALRQTAVRPERAREMKSELERIERAVAELKEIVKEQALNALSRGTDPARRIESIAAIGLVHIALDRFAASGGGFSSPPAQVGPYTVTDLGGVGAIVRTPEGQVYRCATALVEDAGAGITCEAPAK
ncbi:MAG TPA: hypothetical protein VNN77_16660 [candidate division Zixibacteria bacterium]|nr:hypothetical protein [candidate division Zixibacteria bacterium]